MATTRYSLLSGGTVEQWKSVAVAITNAATTTAEIAMGPYTLGGVSNESGGDLTFTLSAAATNGGTSLALKDNGGNAVAAFAVGDDEFRVLPAAIDAVPYLIVTGNAAAATGVTLHFKRQG